MSSENPLLKIQLKKNKLSGDVVPSAEEWAHFLNEVSESYDQFEVQHDRLNRALFISTEEANEALERIRGVNADMEEALELMRTQMVGLVSSYPERISVGEDGLDGLDSVDGLVGQFKYLAQTWQGLVSEADELRVEADAANEAKSSFLASMSHEIRTPLNGVIGMSELLVGTKLTHSQREYVETIQTCGETLLALIDGILDYSKIEAGEMHFDEKLFSLNHCVEDCIDMMRYVVSQKRIHLLFDLLEGGERFFMGDEMRFRQVLTNLLGNASKFTEEGEIVVEAGRNTVEGRMGEWLIRVRDTGQGIPADEIGRLFEVFYQVKSGGVRTEAGTGLGLAISQRIVKEMGGEMWAESEEGVGSVFSFSFTLPEVTMEEMPAVIEEREKMGWIEGKRVMIVDDNTTNLKILARQLSYLKADVCVFSGVDDLLERVEADGLPDLLITDQEMPVMMGEELARKLMGMSDDEGGKLRVLLVSSVPVKDLGLARSKVAMKPLRRSDLMGYLGELGIESGDVEVAEVVADDVDRLRFEGFPYKILVVEDNSINQRLVQLMLKKMGLEADYCEDGEMAVDYVREHKPEIILMDIQMPKMDGYQATKAIREMKLESQPMILGLTANALTDERARAYRVGMDDYLTKPVILRVLFEALQRARRIVAEGRSDG